MSKTKRIFFCILGIASTFFSATLFLALLSMFRPPFNSTSASEAVENGRYDLHFPSNLEDLKSLASLIKQYRKDNFSYVVLLFCSAYLYKQTFAIPGSVFMNLLAGTIFGIWAGFPLVCLLTACGATFCYLLSKAFGKVLLLEFFPERLQALQEKVKENLDSLFFFLLFLRLFPMSPNWFLNMSSPVLDVPIVQFFFSVLIGLMPYNFICCQTGCILSQLESLDELFTVSVIIKLCGIALVALLPALSNNVKTQMAYLHLFLYNIVSGERAFHCAEYHRASYTIEKFLWKRLQYPLLLHFYVFVRQDLLPRIPPQRD